MIATSTSRPSFPALDIEVCAECGVLACRGRMVFGQPVERVVCAARAVLEADGHLSLDLSGIVQIDAHGLGALAQIAAVCLDAEDRPALVGAPWRVERLLQLVRLNGFFDAEQVRQRTDPARLSAHPSSAGRARPRVDLRRCS